MTRTAYFEPVATVSAHQRRGIAKALLTEGLLRLQRMCSPELQGRCYAFVGGYSPGANALYRSVMCAAGGGDCELDEVWVKEWRDPLLPGVG